MDSFIFPIFQTGFTGIFGFFILYFRAFRAMGPYYLDDGGMKRRIPTAFGKVAKSQDEQTVI